MAVIQFIKETKAELKHVAWPSRKQAIATTGLVIGLSLAVAFFIAIFDWLFSLVLKVIIN